MPDPRYPKALDLTDEPEWETVEQERDYWKKLANAYGAKITAMQAVMSATFETFVDPETGDNFVREVVEKPPE